MRRPAWLILFAACALDQDAAARAQSAAVPLETLLAKSLGPGSVAMLVEMDRGAGRELLVAAAGLAPEQDIAALMLPTVNWDWVISGYRRLIASRMKRVVVAD